MGLNITLTDALILNFLRTIVIKNLFYTIIRDLEPDCFYLKIRIICIALIKYEYLFFCENIALENCNILQD